MRQFLSDFFSFLYVVLGYWQAFVTGGLLAAIVLLLERFSEYRVKKKPFFAFFILGAMLLAFFLAWRDEHSKLRQLKTQVAELSQDLARERDRNSPNLTGHIGFIGAGDMPDGKTTFFIIYATIANTGAPSVVNDVGFSVNIHGQTIKAIRYSKGFTNIELSNEDVAKEYEPEQLAELAFDRPIPTGGQIAGLVTFVFPGVRRSSIDGESLHYSLHYTDVRGGMYQLSESDYKIDRDEDRIPRLMGSKVRRIEPRKNQ